MKTRSQIEKELKLKNTAYQNNEFIIIDEFLSKDDTITIKTKYGLCRGNYYNLRNNIAVTIVSAIDKTDYFKNMLYEKNKHYRQGIFKVIGKFKNSNTPVILKDKYGYIKSLPTNLLRGTKPKQCTAIFPHNYFLNLLEDRNKEYRKRKFKVISNYINQDTKITLKDSLSEYSIVPRTLIGKNPPLLSFLSSSNNTECFINKSNIIHNNRYTYNNTNYIDCTTPVLITCHIHGDFLQKPTVHISGHGCKTCNVNKESSFSFSNWNTMCPGNPGIFYVLKCFNDKESFIKIGITCNSVEQRYNTSNAMPYNYEILKQIVSFDRLFIWNLEKQNKKILSSYRYSPVILFSGGKTETFTMNSFTDIVID